MVDNGECVLGSLDKAPRFDPITKETVTTVQITKIKEVFARGLALVKKISTDRCLQQKEFLGVASSIDKIQQAMEQITGASAPCVANWQLYCGIFHAAKELDSVAREAASKINELAENPILLKYTAYLDRLKLLNGLPYLLLLSMVFFTLFWYFSAAVCCCCRGGKLIGCFVFLIPHVVLWLIYFILAIVVIATSVSALWYADETKLDFGTGLCSISQFVDHMEVKYPEFYNAVFRDLLAGLVMFTNSCWAALIMSIFVGMYALAICIFRPYAREKKPRNRSEQIRLKGVTVGSCDRE